MFILLSSCRAVACSDLWLLQPVDVDSSVGLFPAADLFLEATKMYTERDRTGAVFPVSVLLPSQTLQRQVVSAVCGTLCGPHTAGMWLPHLCHTGMGGTSPVSVEQLGLQGK